MLQSVLADAGLWQYKKGQFGRHYGTAWLILQKVAQLLSSRASLVVEGDQDAAILMNGSALPGAPHGSGVFGVAKDCPTKSLCCGTNAFKN